MIDCALPVIKVAAPAVALTAPNLDAKRSELGVPALLQLRDVYDHRP